MTEHQIQNNVREVLAYYHDLNIFRANVGKGYLCHKINNPNGSAGFTTPRWFDTGLPVGFPDLFGYKVITITPEMVGKKLPWFLAMECKTPKGKLRPEQAAMLQRFDNDGCLNAVIRSVEDAIILTRGGEFNG